MVSDEVRTTLQETTNAEQFYADGHFFLLQNRLGVVPNWQAMLGLLPSQGHVRLQASGHRSHRLGKLHPGHPEHRLVPQHGGRGHRRGQGQNLQRRQQEEEQIVPHAPHTLLKAPI